MITLVASLTAGSVLAADRTVPDPGEIADSNFAFDNLEVLDDGLQGRLDVLRVGSGRTSTDLLSVYAGLKNRTARPLKIEVQTIYKDKSGNRLNGKGSWIPLTLKPHQQMEYCSASISEEAVDFVVRIRTVKAR